MGPYLLRGEEPDEAAVRERAARLGFDAEAFLKALPDMPVCEPERAEAALSGGNALAALLGNMAVSSAKARDDAPQNLIDAIPLPVFVV